MQPNPEKSQSINRIKYEQYEMESLLYEVDYHGVLIIKVDKVLRLLGKGNKAAGTWRALVDIWEGIGGARSDLYVAELTDGMLLITTQQLDRLTKWAGE